MNATQSAASAQSARSGRPARWARHPVNIGHLVMGIAFVGLVGVWVLIDSDVVDGGDVRWLLPVPWVLAGIAGLLATTITGQRRHANSESGWVDTRDAQDDPAYDSNPNRDLDEKIDAAARERQTARATDTAPDRIADLEPATDDTDPDADPDEDGDEDGTAI